jgi:hypothetical protein
MWYIVDKTMEWARRYNLGHTMVANDSQNGGKTRRVGDRGVCDSRVGDNLAGTMGWYIGRQDERIPIWDTQWFADVSKIWRNNDRSINRPIVRHVIYGSPSYDSEKISSVVVL